MSAGVISTELDAKMQFEDLAITYGRLLQFDCTASEKLDIAACTREELDNPDRYSFEDQNPDEVNCDDVQRFIDIQARCAARSCEGTCNKVVNSDQLEGQFAAFSGCDLKDPCRYEYIWLAVILAAILICCCGTITIVVCCCRRK